MRIYPDKVARLLDEDAEMHSEDKDLVQATLPKHSPLASVVGKQSEENRELLLAQAINDHLKILGKKEVLLDKSSLCHFGSLRKVIQILSNESRSAATSILLKNHLTELLLDIQSNLLLMSEKPRAFAALENLPLRIEVLTPKTTRVFTNLSRQFASLCRVTADICSECIQKTVGHKVYDSISSMFSEFAEKVRKLTQLFATLFLKLFYTDSIGKQEKESSLRNAAVWDLPNPNSKLKDKDEIIRSLYSLEGSINSFFDSQANKFFEKRILDEAENGILGLQPEYFQVDLLNDIRKPVYDPFPTYQTLQEASAKSLTNELLTEPIFRGRLSPIETAAAISTKFRNLPILIKKKKTN